MTSRTARDRIPFRLKIKYVAIDQFLIDYFENISKGGSFVRTEKPLQAGTRLHLELEIAGVPVFVKLRGRVAWVNDPLGEWHRKDLDAGMGIIFIFHDDASKLLLEALVDKLKSEPKINKARKYCPEFMTEIIENLRPDIRRMILNKAKNDDKYLYCIGECTEDGLEMPTIEVIKDGQGKDTHR